MSKKGTEGLNFNPSVPFFILGDMNRYGKYNKNDRKAFDQMLRGNWQKRYRFPLLEAITDPDDIKVYRAGEDEYSTTVASSKNLYDQFVITQGTFNEFGVSNPKLGIHIGIIAFDRDTRFQGLSHNEVKYQVSDHRPVWIRLRTDLPDDD